MVRTLRYAVLCSLFVGAVKAEVDKPRILTPEVDATLTKIEDYAKRYAQLLADGAGSVARVVIATAKNNGEPVPSVDLQRKAEEVGAEVATVVGDVAKHLEDGVKSQDSRTVDGMSLPKSNSSEEKTKSVFANAGVYCTAAATQAASLVAAHPYMAVGGAVAVVAVVWAGYKLKQLACAPVRVKNATRAQRA